MKLINPDISKLQNLLSVLSLIFLVILGNAGQAFAHGGEDHAEEKPKVATTAKGTVSRSARLGEYEITLKTPTLEPDTATAARLFITKFETNDAVSNETGIPTMEIESAGGAAVTRVAVEKTDATGSYNLKIPALPEGSYTVRTSLKTNKGSDTATFSSVEVAHPTADAAIRGTASWLGTALLFLFGVIVLGLFAGLFYFARRMASEKQAQVQGETVSA